MPVLVPPSDLLRQFRHGDLDAFETLFRQHQTEVYSWIARIVRDPATAEDLTIETFWRIYRAHARFDAVRSFGAWARRIATNAALDHLKTERQQVPV
jgi:RNA polymerase sigma-70 factor (ECF subfamily)